MVKRLDEALGRLLDALQSLDLLENTIVVFTSDHGNHFKTRNGEYKRSCHESSIRIPMAIQGPGFDAGGRIQKLVSLLDLPPTPDATITRAWEMAKAEGMRFAYVGNIPQHPGNNTYCPHDGKLLVARLGYEVLENHIKDGKCEYCAKAIPGIWK